MTSTSDLKYRDGTADETPEPTGFRWYLRSSLPVSWPYLPYQPHGTFEWLAHSDLRLWPGHAQLHADEHRDPPPQPARDLRPRRQPRPGRHTHRKHDHSTHMLNHPN